MYRGFDGKFRVFRPGRAVSRLRVSASGISRPLFEPSEVETLIRALVAIGGPNWLRAHQVGSFLYLRYLLIGTEPKLEIRTPRKATLYIIMSFMPWQDTIAEALGDIRLVQFGKVFEP